jgi:hypothetical protein
MSYIGAEMKDCPLEHERNDICVSRAMGEEQASEREKRDATFDTEGKYTREDGRFEKQSFAYF